MDLYQYTWAMEYAPWLAVTLCLVGGGLWRRRRTGLATVLMLGGSALTAQGIHEAWLVANGGIPVASAATWRTHIGFTTLAAALLFGGHGRQTYGFASTAAAGSLFALGGALPAVVVWGTGALESELRSRRLVAALVGLLTAQFLATHGKLWLWDSLRRWMSLGMDGATIASAQVVGALRVFGWCALLSWTLPGVGPRPLATSTNVATLASPPLAPGRSDASLPT